MDNENARIPVHGTGKPEPLKHALAGYWSRRITAADRIVYKVEGASLYIVQTLKDVGYDDWLTLELYPNNVKSLADHTESRRILEELVRG